MHSCVATIRWIDSNFASIAGTGASRVDTSHVSVTTLMLSRSPAEALTESVDLIESAGPTAVSDFSRWLELVVSSILFTLARGSSV